MDLGKVGFMLAAFGVLLMVIGLAVEEWVITDYSPVDPSGGPMLVL